MGRPSCNCQTGCVLQRGLLCTRERFVRQLFPHEILGKNHTLFAKHLQEAALLIIATYNPLVQYLPLAYA